MFKPLIAALIVATPAIAAEKFTPPANCRLELTVQLSSCQVAQHMTCSDLSEGDRRIVYADGDGEFYDTVIDSETRWVRSTDLRSGTVEVLGREARDPASFSALIATGRDDYDFTTDSTDGVTRRFVGYDALTGVAKRIGGVTLEQTDFELTAYDAAGQMLFRRQGKQFILRDQRLFFADSETFENGMGQSVQTNDAPVTFSFPNDPGFGAAKPEFGCNAMMTGLPAPANGA